MRPAGSEPVPDGDREGSAQEWVSQFINAKNALPTKLTATRATTMRSVQLGAAALRIGRSAGVTMGDMGLGCTGVSDMAMLTE